MRQVMGARAGLTGGLAVLLILAAGPSRAVECGDVITTAVRLGSDLICTTDPALTVRGGALNLNGFTVVCNQTRVGVLLDGSGARLPARRGDRLRGRGLDRRRGSAPGPGRDRERLQPGRVRREATAISSCSAMCFAAWRTLRVKSTAPTTD